MIFRHSQRRGQWLVFCCSLSLGVGLVGSCGEEELTLLPASSEVTPEEVCNVFCTLMWTHCHDVWRPYPTVDACLTACPSFQSDGTIGDVSGDTIQCRLTYVLYARRQPHRQMYCRQGWPDGGALCVGAAPQAR